MKKNKSQIIFFILCVITAAALFYFLYVYRERENIDIARLQQEASAEETTSADDLNASASMNAVNEQGETVSENNNVQQGESTEMIPAESVAGNAGASSDTSEMTPGQSSE